MRRAALLAAAVLAGCGGGGDDDAKTPDAAPVEETVTKRERAEQKRVRERLRESSLPEDMQRELEAAQRLLDESD